MISHTSADFFALRTPALSWNTLATWSDDLLAATASGDADLEAATARDASALRARLRQLIRRPDVRTAIVFASPSLGARLDVWLAGSDDAASRGLEPAIVRYVLRMAGRPTPFGLFAGVSVGEIGTRSELIVAPRECHTRHTRLNLDVLFALAERLSRHPSLRGSVRFRPNGTVYESCGRVRFYSIRLKDNLRSYSLSEVPSSPYLAVALAAAARGEGATAREIAEAVTAAFEGIGIEEAVDFVEGLARAQLVRCTLLPAVTGEDPLHRLSAGLRDTPGAAAIADAVEEIATAIAGLDAGPLEALGESTARISEQLRALAPDLDTTHLLRTNLRKVSEHLSLSASIAREAGESLDLLWRLRPPPRETALARFAREFSRRYGDREVPLLEALDAESGVGFDPAALPGTDASPLLEGLALKEASPEPGAWTKRDERLLTKLAEALTRDAVEIELTATDIAELSNPSPKPLPTSINLVVSLAAASPQALDDGAYKLFVQWSGGASVGALFGRFLQDEGRLDAGVRKILREEQDRAPSALHAEIAHLPQALTSNALSRPLLRDYEIEVGWGSGAPAARRIPLSDLLVSARAGRVVLRSRTHGREVVTHLSCAHALHVGGIPVYRFLASLRDQDSSGDIGWTWGTALGTAPFLPRVVHGRHVLSLARWRLPGERLAAIAALEGGKRFAAVQALRRERKLPRYVHLVEGGDHALAVDLENVLAIDALLSGVKKTSVVRLEEMFPAAEELVARGPEGVFVHELIVPFVRASGAAAPPPPLSSVGNRALTPDRSKRPGEDWVYAKLYCGVAALDRLLVDVVAPFARAWCQGGIVDRWHFVRYGDPDWHLRLRFHGPAGTLWTKVAPALFEALGEARTLHWKSALETYEPEVRRYGGEAAIEIAERIFDADSDAALAIVERHRTDPGARWRLALVGMDRLLDDLGFSLPEKEAIVVRAREGQAGRFSTVPELNHDLGRKYRLLRAEVDDLLAHPPSRYAESQGALERRSRVLRRLSPELRELESRGRLETGRAEIAVSFLHMSANRILRGSANAQELVLYDFLGRSYRSAIARAARGTTARAARGTA